MSLDTLIDQVLPFRWSRLVTFGRAQRYYRQNVLETYTERDLEVIQFLEGKNEHKTILTGNQKSGNTWTRFVIANYFNILTGAAPENTFSFDELYNVQSNVLEYKELSEPPKGFPLFFYSHQHYRKVFEYFNTIAYVFRNPLDTLISYYYFTTKREKPFGSHDLSEKRAKQLMDIDAFILHFIMGWILFHVRTLERANVVLCYEQMKKDPMSQFAPLIKSMTGNVETLALEKSVELSSFDSVRKKQRSMGKPQGHSSSDLNVEFTRSGASDQYLQELKPATIKKVGWAMRRFGIKDYYSL